MSIFDVRRYLIWFHLFLASLLAPAFLLVAISGGLDLADVPAKKTSTPLALPAGAALDFESATIEADVRALLKAAGADVRFEYLRKRDNAVTTRPTSRRHAVIEQTPDGLTAKIETPNLQYALMELHKGHGPRAYRTYQILVALALFLAVAGGLIVGLLANTYRKPTLAALAFGLLVFGLLAFVI